MLEALICVVFHAKYRFNYQGIWLCTKCDHKGPGPRLLNLIPTKKVLGGMAALFVFAACSAPPQCIKSHDEQRVGYHYGYGLAYSCHMSYDGKSTTCGYGYGYGYVFGPYTETVCDAYAPSKND